MLLADWTRTSSLNGSGKTAIVVGCGLGADAEHVASLGFDTVAFDVSPTAIAITRERYPRSPVNYIPADLLALPSEWRRRFDLVVEVITVQALPDPPRRQAIVTVGDQISTVQDARLPDTKRTATLCRRH